MVSHSYVASFAALVCPHDDSLVIGDTYDSMYPYYFGLVTVYYAISESIVVSDPERPMPEVIFVASY